MDPGYVINNAISALAVVSCVAIGAWTLISLVKHRRGKSLPMNAPAPELLQGLEKRLERLEQSSEAIALQVERIAEGQRFVTKLLADAEHQPPRLGAPR